MFLSFFLSFFLSVLSLFFFLSFFVDLYFPLKHESVCGCWIFTSVYSSSWLRTESLNQNNAVYLSEGRYDQLPVAGLRTVQCSVSQISVFIWHHILMTCMTDEIDHWPVLKEMFCHFMDLMAERCLLRRWVGDVMYGSLSTREKEAGVGGGGWAHDGGRHGCHMVLREPWDRHSDIILRRGAQTSLKFWLSLTPQTRKSSPSERNPEADSDKRPRDLFWRWVSRCVARPSNLLSHSDTFFVFLKKRKNKSAPASARRCGFCYSATIKYSSMERSLWFQPAGSLAVMAFMRRG